jgi:hypothetical protein
MMHLELATRTEGDFVYRTAILSNGSKLKSIKLNYKLFGANMPERPGSMDGFAFAVILNAMKNGTGLRIHGPVTRIALYNLEELQRAWTLWRPDVYQHIDIVADQVIDKPPAPENKTLLAFSGGLDSTFSAVRHGLKLAGSGSYDIRSVMMVQGFDIGRDNDMFFMKAVERSQKFLETLSLDMRLITTDSENPAFQDWDDSHGAELACCLHQFSNEFAFGMIGSTKPYNGLTLPNGSNPATDHLLSGSGFTIVHDGAGFSRTSKAELVARHPMATSQLRVCYEGKLQYRNCGQCEKCMRTYLNFLAVGVDNPACFDVKPDLSQVGSIRARNQCQLGELVSIVDFARNSDVNAKWLDDLQNAIEVYAPPPSRIVTRAKLRISTKRMLSKGLGYVGLRRPLKALMHRAYEANVARQSRLPPS